MTKTLKLIALTLAIVFPGLGHVLLGQFLKGTIIFLWSLILACATFIVMPGISPDEIYSSQFIWVSIIVLILLWSYNLFDIIKILRPLHGTLEKEKQRVFREGLDYYISGNFRLAIDKFSQVVKIDPQDIDGILYLGMSYQKSGKQDKADKLFQKYIVLVRQSSTLRASLGKYLTEVGQYGIIELTKQARSLTQHEYTEMKKHAQRGYEVLSKVRGLDKMVALVALQHHERCDGKGYPQGIGISQIDPLVQLVTLVDTYEALSHPRPHRPKKSPDEALKVVLDLIDQSFTKELVRALIEEISFYPPGTRVQLNTGEVAEVIAVNKDAPLKPHIIIKTDAQGSNLSIPHELDLRQTSVLSISRVII